MDDILNIILQYRIEDKKIWCHVKNVDLSTKSAYNLISGKNQVVRAMIKGKAFWKLPLPR